MGRPELGTKRTDPENGRKFYDLGRDPIVSPYTGTAYPLSFFDPPAGSPSRQSAASRFVHRAEKPDEDAAGKVGDDEEDTVSLADIEDDEEAETKAEASDVDGSGDDEQPDDDRILALDDEDEDGELNEIVATRGDDE